MPNSPLATHEVEMGARERADDTTVGDGVPVAVRVRKGEDSQRDRATAVTTARACVWRGEGSAPSSCSARTSSGGRTAHANSASTSSRGPRADRSRGSRGAGPPPCVGGALSFGCALLCFCVAPAAPAIADRESGACGPIGAQARPPALLYDGPLDFFGPMLSVYSHTSRNSQPLFINRSGPTRWKKRVSHSGVNRPLLSVARSPGVASGAARR